VDDSSHGEVAQQRSSPSEAPSPPWRPIEALFVGLTGFGLGVVLSIIVVLATPDRGLRLVFSLLVGSLSLSAATIAWVAFLHRGAFAALGLRTRRPVGDVAIGIVVGVLSYPLIVLVLGALLYTLLSLLAGGPVTPPRQELLPRRPDELEVAIGAVSAILVAPVAEELFFRGFLFGALRRRFGVGIAAVASAVPFALVHLYLLLMPLLFAFGIVLAYIYERRGSLFASMAAHAAFNVVGFLVYLLL
jgi:membrane protease YdiL (CAAX protease family)